MSDTANDHHTELRAAERLAVMGSRIEDIARRQDALAADVHGLRESIRANERGRFEKAWSFVAQFALPIALIVGGAVWRLSDRVTVIESNRMPATAIRDEMTSMRREFADAPMLRDIRDAIVKLQTSQDLTRADVGAVKERIVRVETKLDGGR